MRRATALGATDAQLDAALEAPDTVSVLLSLVRELEPPSPAGVTLEALSVDGSALSATPSAAADSVLAQMVERLEHYSAVIVKQLATPSVLDTVDRQLTDCGAFDVGGGHGRVSTATVASHSL